MLLIQCYLYPVKGAIAYGEDEVASKEAKALRGWGG